MPPPREGLRAGLDYLDTITVLLQRVRNAHPTMGLYQAAEPQFWWNTPRSTDSLPQLFWFDDDGSPVAGVSAIDFGDGSSRLYQQPVVVVTVMPDASADWIAHVVDRGFAHIAATGIDAAEIEVDRADHVMRGLLAARGFVLQEDGLIECWLASDRRPAISALHEDYRLLARSDLPGRHHLTNPRRPNLDERLGQLSLYRPDLDLVVLDRHDIPAAYGLFWFDPATATGVVEPMRTHDQHRRRGLARHILTSGIELLADAGAERTSIGFEPDNPASGPLYLSVGFEPHRRTDVFVGPV